MASGTATSNKFIIPQTSPSPQANIANSGTTSPSLNPSTAALILNQFDQKTQMQALSMLRQINSQQHIQQMQQLQQIQQLQAIQALQNMKLQPKKVANSSGHGSVSSSDKFTVKDRKFSITPVRREAGPDGETFIVPSEEAVKEIILAAEFYFSDENLAKDHYLLRQICQKSEGFLSVKLLTALKNVKRLTKDWRVTSYALQRSSLLKINDEKTKVKRIADLPEYVLKARSITNVIAIKIPMEYSSVSAITQLFSQYGKITLVRVLLPGRQVPCDLRNYATQVPDMGTTLCAIIEYDTEAEACNACRDLNCKKSSTGMRSALLGPRLRRNLYKVPCTDAVLTNSETLFAIKEDGLLNAQNKQAEDQQQKTASWSSIVTGKQQQPPPSTSDTPCPKARDSGCDASSNDASSNHSGNKSPSSPRKPSIFDLPMKTVGAVSENPLKVKESAEPMKPFDRAPGSHRKQSKLQITINSTNTSVVRQPKGPIGGSGFSLRRIVVE